MPIFRRENGSLVAVPGNYAFLDELGKLTADSMLIKGLISQINLGNSTYFGFEAGINDDKSTRNNTGIGYQALRANTNGFNNVAVGSQTLLANSVGFLNVAVGLQALKANIGGDENTALGSYALYDNISGNYNVALGLSALEINSIGSNNIALGYFAGKYETGNDAFYVNNQDRINTTADKTESIIYGQMAALVANQKLTFNAEVKINGKTGLNNVTPVGMAAHIADPTDLATSITAIKAILVVLENLGAVATA